MLAGKKRLPDWMRVPRWFTRDPNERRIGNAGDTRLLIQQVAANGGGAVRLGCFQYGEAFFQSAVVPHTPGLGELDFLREGVDEGARLGVKIAMYMNPNCLHERDPLYESCALRNAEGGIPDQRPYGEAGMRFACINNPIYLKFLRDLLTEVFTKYKPDGLYVDGLSPHLCFCEYCRRKYQEIFSQPMPVDKFKTMSQGMTVWAELDSDPQPMGNADDPDWQRLTDMFYQSVGEVTGVFSQTVKAAKPDAMTMFHSYPKANSEKYYDATLTEVLGSGRPWVHIAWQTGEMANYSNIFDVPALFNNYNSRHSTAHSASWQSYQMLANGCYPNYWNTAGMKPVFDFMGRNAEYLDFDTASPVKFLALVRDYRLSPTQRSTALPPGVAYKQDRFLAPYIGAYSALMRSSLPICTLHRPHFEASLQGFRTLCLANVALMSDAQVAAVQQFVRAGGGLIATHETSLYDEKGQQRPDFALASLFGVHYGRVLPAGPRKIEFAKNNPLGNGLQNIDHDEPHVVVKPDGASVAAWLTADDVPAQSAPAVATHSFGKGRVVYVPGRLAAMQCETLNPATERLFATAVGWLAHNQVPVHVEAAGIVGVTLFQQPQRYLVHLLNYQRDTLDRSEDYQPIHNLAIHVQLPPGAHATNARALWSDQQLSHEQRGETVSVPLPALDEYELLAIDWRS
ncbi:MAG: alpha-amylase family protein [Bryobacteraceae bacterium]|jgi:hypothetical protein